MRAKGDPAPRRRGNGEICDSATLRLNARKPLKHKYTSSRTVNGVTTKICSWCGSPKKRT